MNGLQSRLIIYGCYLVNFDFVQECIKKQNASTGRVENSCRKASEVLPTLLTDVKAIEDRITSLKASKDTIKYVSLTPRKLSASASYR